MAETTQKHYLGEDEVTLLTIVYDGRYAKPGDLPTKTSELTNDSGFQTAAIETIEVNGTAVAVTAKKASITTATKTSDLTNDSNFAVDAAYVHTDNNLTDALAASITDSATKVAALEGVNAEHNTIVTVKRNGTAVTPDESRAINIEVPTAGSGITNDLNWQTQTQVEAIAQAAAAAAVTKVYKVKGSVANFAALPTDAVAGDVYNVIAEDGMNYVWTGEEWDKLGVSSPDLSGYALTADLPTPMNLAQIQAAVAAASNANA